MKLFPAFLLPGLLSIILFNCNGQVPTQISNGTNAPGQFSTIEKRYERSAVDGYNLYIPNSCADHSTPCPLIVFLQGGLGVGGEVSAIFNWELPKKMKATTQLNNELDSLRMNTFIYIMPHISTGQFYQNEAAIQQVIQEVSQQYSVDTSRIYLTGLSRGGHGVWGLASRLPGQFAAIAPICGSPRGINNYKALAGIPIWTSHNAGDGVVQSTGTDNVVNKIEAMSGESFTRAPFVNQIDYTSSDRIYIAGTGTDHNVWAEMYDSAAFYKWLLKYQRK